MRSLAFLPIVVVLAGCQSPTLVGEWKAEGAADMMQSSYTLRADGTFSSSASIASPLGFPIQVNASGTWTLERNNFRTRIKDFDVLGLPLENQLQTREIRQARLSGTIQWVTSDRFNLIADRTGAVLAFHRVRPAANQ